MKETILLSLVHFVPIFLLISIPCSRILEDIEIKGTLNTKRVDIGIIHVLNALVSQSPPKIRGGGGGVCYLVFEIWTKRGVMKKLLRNRGLVEREDTLRKGEFPDCFISFP